MVIVPDASVARLVPSLMCMSMLDVRRDLEVMEEYFDEIHIDIMDGHFCGGIHLSPNFVRDVRSVWRRHIDVHLMVERPEHFLDDIMAAGASSVAFHFEVATANVNRLIAKVRGGGIQVGIAVCPSTPIQALDDLLGQVDRVTILGVDPGYVGQPLLPAAMRRLKYLAQAKQVDNLKFDVCIDGGVRWENWHDLVCAGANRLIVGHGALFDKGETVRSACVAAIKRFELRGQP